MVDEIVDPQFVPLHHSRVRMLMLSTGPVLLIALLPKYVLLHIMSVRSWVILSRSYNPQLQMMQNHVKKQFFSNCPFRAIQASIAPI